MAKPTTIDEYLEALPDDQRRALSKLRAQIHAAAPGAEESIGYGLPAFKMHGRPLIYIGAAKHHCAIYGARAEAGLATALKDFTHSKGTIQFTPEKPIPATVVKRIVKARLAALEARVSAATKTTTKPTKETTAKVRRPKTR